MNEVLNKKLAEWAGLPLDATDFGLPYNQQVYKPPNFTESLDACFKWLVPKLPLKKINWKRNWGTESDLYMSFRTTWEIVLDLHEIPFHVEGKDNNPALALCLAIEKLLEVKDEYLAVDNY